MSDEEVQQAAELLKKLEPGFLPHPIFEQVARLVALPILEVIPLRRKDGKTEVLLLERPADDSLWPGRVHTPGTVIRATDLHKGENENWEAMERILRDELKNTQVSKPHYVGSILHTSKRGVEQAQLYYVEVLGEPQTGSLFDVNNLPENLIESQQKFIQEAVRHFVRSKEA